CHGTRHRGCTPRRLMMPYLLHGNDQSSCSETVISSGVSTVTFADIATQFSQSQSGSDSFKQLHESAFELMKRDPDNAGLYFVVGIAAQTYVIKHEDQAVAPEFADR